MKSLILSFIGWNFEQMVTVYGIIKVYVDLVNLKYRMHPIILYTFEIFLSHDYSRAGCLFEN